MPTSLSNCCKARIMLRTAYQTIYPSCIKCDKPCDYTPHQEGEEKKYWVDGCSLCELVCTTHQVSYKPRGRGSTSFIENTNQVCKCAEIVRLIKEAHKHTPTTKQGEDEFTQNTFRGATNLLYPPTTQSWEKAELAAFWEEIAAHLPKSLERSALGDEKISFAFKVAYPKMKSYIVATALKEQEERLVKALELGGDVIDFEGELRPNGRERLLALIKSTK